MFLSWNYTLELFFWIIVGAVVLVSLTILLAGPKFRAKVAKLSEDPLSLTGKNIDSYNQKKVSKKINSSKIEEDVDFIEEKVESEVLKGRLPFFTKVYGVIFLYALYSSLVTLYGILIIYSEICHEIGLFASAKTCNQGGVRRWSSNFEIFSSFGHILLGAIFSLTGLSSLYGFLIENKRWLKYSCRITTIAFLLSIIFITGGGPMNFAFMLIPLIVSGDLKLVWAWINNYDENKVNDENKMNGLGVLYSLFLLFVTVLLFTGGHDSNILLIYFISVPLSICALSTLYYFLINDERNIQTWNRFAAVMLLFTSIFEGLRNVYMDEFVIILSFSALISLHFSGDLKQFGLGVDNYDMTLRDVSLLLFVGLLLVIFWILIGITFLSILIPILVIAALLTKRLLSSK